MELRLIEQFELQKQINAGLVSESSATAGGTVAASPAGGLPPDHCISVSKWICPSGSPCRTESEVVCSAALPSAVPLGGMIPLGLGLVVLAARLHPRLRRSAVVSSPVTKGLALALCAAGVTFSVPDAQALRDSTMVAPCEFRIAAWQEDDEYWNGEMEMALVYAQTTPTWFPFPGAWAYPKFTYSFTNDRANFEWLDLAIDDQPVGTLAYNARTFPKNGRIVRSEITFDSVLIEAFAAEHNLDPYTVRIGTFLHELGHSLALADVSGTMEAFPTTMNNRALYSIGTNGWEYMVFSEQERNMFIGDQWSCN